MRLGEPVWVMLIFFVSPIIINSGGVIRNSFIKEI